MRKTRALSIFLAASLVLALALTGCSPKNDSNANTGESSITPKDTSTSAKVNTDSEVTISGMGVDKTLDAEALDSYGNFAAIYTSVNNWPTDKTYSAQGIDLKKLLDDLGVTPTTVTFESSDGYAATLTYDELTEERFTFYNDQKTPVKPILAFQFAEGDSLKDSSQNGLTLVFGQLDKNEHTNPDFVETVSKITLSDAPLEQWEPPTIFPTSMTVSKGETVKLLHPSIGKIKIYYTTDGTDPTAASTMYNPSTYQPELNKPIQIDEDTTIKTIAIGYGKLPSAVETFDVKVK